MSRMFAGHTISQGGNLYISVITTRLELFLPQSIKLTFHSSINVWKPDYGSAEDKSKEKLSKTEFVL